MKKLLVWAALIAGLAGAASSPVWALEVSVGGGGITQVERDLSLDASGTTASASVTVAAIPLPASEHSPHCSNGRWKIGDIPVAGNRTSECVRVCLRPPAGYEINAAAGVTGSTSHAWSATFNPEWFNDTKISCIHVKNWSHNLEAVATLTVGVCPAGSGCAKAAPPPAPVPIAARTRVFEPNESPMRVRISR